MNKKIVLARIDKRLLHATVTLNWDRFINADYVAVVGSEYDDNPFVSSVMQLCLPKSMKVKILSEEGLIEFMNQAEEFGKSAKVMVIFKNLVVASRCVSLGLKVKEIQMPYPSVAPKVKKLSSYFTEAEIKEISFIQQSGIRFYFQTTPYEMKDYGSFCN